MGYTTILKFSPMGVPCRILTFFGLFLRYLYIIQSKYAVLHEHINYQGSQLKIARGLIEDNLVPYGWNDRASSLSHIS